MRELWIAIYSGGSVEKRGEGLQLTHAPISSRTFSFLFMHTRLTHTRLINSLRIIPIDNCTTDFLPVLAIQ